MFPVTLQRPQKSNKVNFAVRIKVSAQRRSIWISQVTHISYNNVVTKYIMLTC